ncbi:MAG: ATP-binding protein [Bacteroidaceae bacterium]|nr:ATP-binding protein [Bacteroidaceae bacterium]
MQERRGSLSIDSENIFPIIKKWLYSDHDIFLREAVSNGCDAITKLKKLALVGEAELPEDYKPKLTVRVSSVNKTISITDNGIGMTADEVDRYINQIAFSGAADFLNRYKDKANEDQIIGHFGLGFYSVFMVSDRVTIDTLSFEKDAEPVHWESEGGIDFEMTDGGRKEVGTTVTLYLSEDSYEFSNEYRQVVRCLGRHSRVRCVLVVSAEVRVGGLAQFAITHLCTVHVGNGSSSLESEGINRARKGGLCMESHRANHSCKEHVDFSHIVQFFDK